MDSIGAHRTLITLVLSVLVAHPMTTSGQELPRFETAECFAGIRAWAGPMGVECGWLVVPHCASARTGPRLAPARRAAAREGARRVPARSCTCTEGPADRAVG